MEEKGIRHRNVDVNGISLHLAEKGEEGRPAVLLLHGFPELWYSWRHQILHLADRGYRAIAPDLRGYGDSSAPPSIASYSVLHIVADLVALLDALSIPQVYLVGHDWGAFVAWHLCMVRPDRVRALVNLSVAFFPHNPAVKTLEYFRSLYGDDYYISRFQEPGDIEAEFACAGTENVLRRLFTGFEPSPMTIPKGFFLQPEEVALPPWLSQEDINYYTSKFEKNGFAGPVNYYRCLDMNWELGATWMGVQIKVPVKFVVGDLDMTYHYPGLQDYIHKGGFKRDVPSLEEVVVMGGVGHFINQEKAQEISDHIYDFIQKY